MNRVNLFISTGEMHEEFSPDGEFVYYTDAQAAIQEAVLAEREAAASICENASTPDGWSACGIADAIRARSQK